MLENYLNKMQEQHSLNPIDEGEFETWKGSKVTKRFFADFQELILLQVEDIGKETSDSEAIVRHSIEFNTSYTSYQTLIDWKPDELDEVDA